MASNALSILRFDLVFDTANCFWHSICFCGIKINIYVDIILLLLELNTLFLPILVAECFYHLALTFKFKIWLLRFLSGSKAIICMHALTKYYANDKMILALMHRISIHPMFELLDYCSSPYSHFSPILSSPTFYRQWWSQNLCTSLRVSCLQ